MCVGLPAKVVNIKDGVAIIDASGVKREISAELIDELELGDYVMVHAGIAIADPIYRTIIQLDTKFISLPHEAFLGKIYRRNIPNLIDNINMIQ